MAGKQVLNTIAIEESDVTTPQSTQKYPEGTEVVLGATNDLTHYSRYKYVKAHDALTQYQPYKIENDGTNLLSAAPATGAGQVIIPQVAVTSGYWFFGLVEGEGTCKIGAETYVAGDELELLNAGTTAVVNGTSGSTVQTVKSFAVSRAAGSAAAGISVYLYGNKADISGS